MNEKKGRLAKLGDAAKRAKAFGGIFVALAGTTQAPPPGSMNKELAKQWEKYAEVRLEETRRQAYRINSKIKTTDTSLQLNRKDAKKLRS